MLVDCDDPLTVQKLCSAFRIWIPGAPGNPCRGRSPRRTWSNRLARRTERQV